MGCAGPIGGGQGRQHEYLAPTLLGVVVYGEVMPAERWVGFGLVWVALVVFTVDLVRSRPRRVAEEVVGAAECR